MTTQEFLASSERSIGMLYLSRFKKEDHPGEWVYEVWIDGDLLMSSVSPLSERELATRAIAAHPGTGPLRVVVGGLGLGYTAQAALESERTTHVRVVDAMDFVIEWAQQGLIPLSKQLTEDPRMDFALGDVYADLLGPATEAWDLLLIDVDHAPHMPLDPSSLPFYTAEGQRAVKQHLAPNGILAVWSAHDNDDFVAELEKVYAKVWRETIQWDVTFPDGDVQHLDNTLFFATDPL